MTKTVLQLYPANGHRLPLTHLYLNQNLRKLGKENDRPYLYANFITSLDGRIAVADSDRCGASSIPKTITNERDWRLFQELAVQADLIISSGRYLRDWEEGHGQEILQTDDPRFEDLREWRKQQGLNPLPDIAVISRSLNFTIPDVMTDEGRKVIVFTTKNSDEERLKEIQAKAERIFCAGQESIDGKALMHAITRLGYKTVYSAAGPRILHSLLSANVLDRLYVTQTHCLLGGHPFSSIVEGDLLKTTVGLKLRESYLDESGANGGEQLFLSYDVKRE